MAVRVLAPARAAALARAPFSYGAVGATADEAPHGYDTFARSRLLAGRDFAAAAEDLMAWRVHDQGGVTLAASSQRVEEGVVVLLGLGLGALTLLAPCRIADVVDEPRRRGFAHGTLPGHPGVYLRSLDQLGQ